MFLAILHHSLIDSAPPELKYDGLHGYINAAIESPPAEFGYGVSLYSSAWPLVEKPVAGLQVGLASTWILPDNRKVDFPLVPKGTVARDSMPERGPSFWTVFQTIEGGLGFWTSNRYFAPTAKFRMNGSVDGYNHEVSTPGWDFYGRPLPGEYMGIAQLSPWALVPPDGMTLNGDSVGRLFGYAWMALPLLDARERPVKTGSQCWTAFLNTENFKGPVAFYIPSIWSRMSRNYEPAVGRGLDALPGLANSGAIEIGSMPQLIGAQEGGAAYHRIPQMQFPVDKAGETVLFHDMTAYSKSALWNQVLAWRKGGTAPSGRFNPSGAFLPSVKANPMAVEQGGRKTARGVEAWVQTASLDRSTFGLKWNPSLLQPWKGGFQRGLFPAYYRHDSTGVSAVDPESVPESSGLKSAEFPMPDMTQSYVPSEDGAGVWRSPGPKSGPCLAKLADGSQVTYYWYRFVDQPALQNSDLGPEEKAKLQALVERIHRSWTAKKTYMAPPRRGRLAALDPGLLVRPPKGMEAGYVPVAMRQDPRKAN